MKRLLATAIALATLGALPVAAQSEISNDGLSTSQVMKEAKSSIWLILVLRGYLSEGGGSSMTKIEMKDLDQCNEQGALYVANQAIQPGFREGREFICLEGK